jgi:uncharacterized protein
LTNELLLLLKPREFDTKITKAIIKPLCFALFETKVYSFEMIIDLITLEKPSFEFDLRIDPKEIDLETSYARLKRDAKVSGVLTRHAVRLDVDGSINTELEIDCTRCLHKIEQTVEIVFQTAWVAPEDFPDAKELELTEKDLDVSIIEDNKISIAEIVREQILLNLPQQILCMEDCKGLCPQCGSNRNLISCSCLEEKDSRLIILESLK